MRFYERIKLTLVVLICLFLGAIFGEAIIANKSEPNAMLIVGFLIILVTPLVYFIVIWAEAKCGNCGENWSLEKKGYQDGNITELHERIGQDELRLVHKWTRYQDWKCKNCGNETTTSSEHKKTV